MHEPNRRSHRLRSLLAMLAAVAVAAALPLASVGAEPWVITTSKIVGGLSAPTQVTNAGDGTNRLFVAEARGTIRVVENGALKAGYFMDIRTKVADGGERGLLGIAFDPDFETNRRLFVYYTRNGGDIVVARYKTNASRTNVDESTGKPILLIEHSAAGNHNGGGMAFGPDGFLYIAVGDGGGSGDPGNDAQRKDSLLGKVLRINTDGTGQGTFDRYSIPKSNPYAGPTQGRGEIWARGLRNPWRISFDRGTGALFVADVGQERYEEINRQSAGAGGRNYGWNAMEGKHCYKPSKCPKSGDTLPVAEYTHAGGNCSITGGYVYRGPTQADLVGQYVFADFCSGKIWSMPQGGSTITLRRDTTENISSFGEHENGELYMVTFGGSLFRILAS